MSNPNKSKLMQTSRDQFKSTKDGAVTYATKDIDLAYAHGFRNGRASMSYHDNVSPDTLELIKALSGKSLIEMYMQILHEESWSITENKNEVLERLNERNETNYNVNALNNWIAERKPTPSNIQDYIRNYVIAYLLGDDVAVMLEKL